MTPTIGRIVHYRLNAANVLHCLDADGIRYEAGDVVPMIITRVNSSSAEYPGSVNGQVFCDGPGVLWLVGIKKGTELGQWSWPPKV